MGNIPIYERQVGTVRPSRTYTQVPAGLERKTRAKERVAGFLGDMLGKVISGVMKVESDTQYNQAVTETQKRTNQFILGLQDLQLPSGTAGTGAGLETEMDLKNPDFMGFNERYIEFQTQAKEDALSKITMPGLKKTVGSKLDALFAAADIKVQEIQRRKVLERGRAGLNVDIEHYVNTRNIDDLVRRVNGAADLEYIDHKVAEEEILKGTFRINTANALDDTMSISRSAGIDAATSMLLSDEAGDKYSLTYKQRVVVANNAKTAWGLEEGVRIREAKQQSLTSYWQAYNDIHAEQPTLTHISQLDDPKLYPGLSVSEKKELHKEMEAKAAAGYKASQEHRKAEMGADLSSVKITLDDLSRGVGNAEEAQAMIQAFINTYPEYESQIDQLTTQYSGLMSKEQDKAELLYKSDIERELADHYEARTLSAELIDDVSGKVSDYTWGGAFVDKWTMRLSQMRGAMEKEAKQAAEQNAWETTGQDYRNQYIDMGVKLSRGELTIDDARSWLVKNKGPGVDGEPRIGNKDFIKWWDAVNKWQKDPPYLTSALAGIAKTYDAEIKELKDPDKIGALVEEKLNVMEKFHDDVIKNEYDQKEMAAIRKEIEDPVKAETGDLLARRFLQGTFFLRGLVKPPEEQMVEWAREGRLDDRGRLIGKTDAEQLKLMDMDSFDQLKWKGQLKRQYEATGQVIENISTPGLDTKPAFTYILDDQGQPFKARNDKTGEIRYFVLIDGEQKWINTE